MLRRKLLKNESETSKKSRIETLDVLQGEEVSPYFISSQNNLQNECVNEGPSKIQYTITETHEPLQRNDGSDLQQSALDLSLPCTSTNDYGHGVLVGTSINGAVNGLHQEPQALNIEEQMLNLQRKLNNTLKTLNMKIPPVAYIYNPLEYAFNPNEIYVRKYCRSTKKLLFMGMNPGPYGMCQTGVPFGDPQCVREFLGIEAIVNKPEVECPFREILGFSSSRREQSGKRMWNFIQSLCHTPENFFKNAFLCNYCPLALMKENGCNITPPDLKKLEIRKTLEDLCKDWYIEVIRLLQPEIIIAIGSYMHKITKDLVKAKKIDNLKLLCMPHPSPRSVNNQNWHEKAEKFVNDNNLIQYFRD